MGGGAADDRGRQRVRPLYVVDERRAAGEQLGMMVAGRGARARSGRGLADAHAGSREQDARVASRIGW